MVGYKSSARDRPSSVCDKCFFLLLLLPMYLSCIQFKSRNCILYSNRSRWAHKNLPYVWKIRINFFMQSNKYVCSKGISGILKSTHNRCNIFCCQTGNRNGRHTLTFRCSAFFLFLVAAVCPCDDNTYFLRVTHARKIAHKTNPSLCR